MLHTARPAPDDSDNEGAASVSVSTDDADEAIVHAIFALSQWAPLCRSSGAVSP